jgi:undecaprenyl-diphosphatase
MDALQAIILGIVQGITEFLPISSSGHLVIVPYLLGWEFPEKDKFVFDVLVQVATMVAVIAYFWSDLWGIARGFIRALLDKAPFGTHTARLGWYLILATIPASLVGLAFKDVFERAFSTPLAAAGFLLLTAVLLLVAERMGKRRRQMESLTWKDALWIGCFQILALFPGVSRSGATITGAMLRDIDRPTAARFSFLMVVPVMLAAGLLAIIDLFQIPDFASLLPAFSWGFLASAVTGYFAIRWLLQFLARRPLYVFAVYCTALAALTFLFALV